MPESAEPVRLEAVVLEAVVLVRQGAAEPSAVGRAQWVVAALVREVPVRLEVA